MNGVEPTPSLYPPVPVPPKVGGLTVICRFGIRTMREQRLDDLQFGLTIGNAANRIDEAVNRICQPVFPRARCPVQRREAGIDDVGIGPVIEQEQRERNVAPDDRDEQGRAAGEARASGGAECTGHGTSARDAASGALVGFRVGLRSDVHVDAGVQQQLRRTACHPSARQSAAR